VKVMTALFGPTDAIERARALRDAGATGVFTFEGPHDVFAPLTLASTVGGLDLMTNVAIAFPRNPIHLAHQAIDHQILTGGRFTLGLGTQIRTQIEKRFGADFAHPVDRMVELIGALRAIFGTWTTGERLNFHGEYYRHTLMTPNFTPEGQFLRPAADLRRCARPAADPGHRTGCRRTARHAVRFEALPAGGDHEGRRRRLGRRGP
jgi:alkanesulfonate monooxygenase SsuD/methylene tetrahydromethanopterin reductase-like flavin-dependent oxidoreductase (luciferase family)